jgi:hypothetical protein
MVKVVEISSHPINSKHGRVGHGIRLLVESSPFNDFFCKAHTDLRSHLTEECKCTLAEEDADTKH